MPVTKSAKKALRRDRRRRKFNLKIQRLVKTAIGDFHKTPGSKKLKRAFSILDRAAKVGLFHKNKSSRLKSHLARLLKTSKS